MEGFSYEAYRVEEAQQSKSQAQALADRAASWLTYIAAGVAVLTLIVWMLTQGFNDATLERVVTTLVVACPHALGLAIPLVIAISTALSARSGILVRDRLALGQARLLNVVVFDKTGTLTTGRARSGEHCHRCSHYHVEQSQLSQDGTEPGLGCGL